METIKFEFPKTLPWGHLIQKGEYMLIESVVNEKGVYAFYEKDVGFGFSHALEIETVLIANNPNTWDKKLIRVKTLSSTCRMSKDAPPRYLICREDYYRDVQEAIDALQGKTRIYKPKRKPEFIREMTEQEIKEHWGLE